jgi:hypothetical protein
MRDELSTRRIHRIAFCRKKRSPPDYLLANSVCMMTRRSAYRGRQLRRRVKLSDMGCCRQIGLRIAKARIMASPAKYANDLSCSNDDNCTAALGSFQRCLDQFALTASPFIFALPEVSAPQAAPSLPQFLPRPRAAHPYNRGSPSLHRMH